MQAPRRVVVVRHGERQDHVDHRWKHTAPRPHDSPLSKKGERMGFHLGVHYFERLLPSAHASLEARATASAASSSTLDLTACTAVADQHGVPELPAVASLLDGVVICSSPLQRCVQTSHHIIDGLRAAAVAHVLGVGATTALDKDAFKASVDVKVFKVVEPLVPKVRIALEDTLVEEDRWMGIDMRSAPLVAANGPPVPVVHDAVTHAAATSTYVDVPISHRPSLLAGVDFTYDSNGRVTEIVAKGAGSTATVLNGATAASAGKGAKQAGDGGVRKRSIQDRVKQAVQTFVHGAPAAAGATTAAAAATPTTSQHAAAGASVVFLVSHGKTTVEWYNTLLRAVKTVEPGAPASSSPGYTAFAEVQWVAKGGVHRYVASSAVFQTPHLHNKPEFTG